MNSPHPRPWASTDRRQRLPANWSALRRRVLRLHHGVCHLCGRPGADSVDHVIPGDDHSLDNLRPAHQDVAPYCHRTKSGQEGAAASLARRPPRQRQERPHPGKRR